jgi:hypothetical protein
MMNRVTVLAGVLALASCGGDEQGLEMQASALSAKSYRILHDSYEIGSCETREYSGDGDWFPNMCKTECNSAATGISSSFAAVAPPDGCWTSYVRLLAPVDPPAGPSYEEFTHKLACNGGSMPGVSVGNGYTLSFARSDDRRSPTVGYDWAPGLYKGECGGSYAITGVATDDRWHEDDSCFLGKSAGKEAYGLVGARCSALTSPAGTYATASACVVLDFTSNSAQEANGTSDWDYGFLKGECGDGRYIKGIAHGRVGSGAGRATRILCCSPSYPNIPG